MSGGVSSGLYNSPWRMVGQYTSNADGTFSISNLMAGLRYWVQPVGSGAFLNDTFAVSGNTVSGSFKQANTGGLGITLGTLLTVQAFNTPATPVVFNLFAAADQALL